MQETPLDAPREHASLEAHRAWLAAQAALPVRFRVGVTRFAFVPAEVHNPSTMTLTLLALDRPTDAFGGLFTGNAFPGAPVLVGRGRLDSPTLGAIVVNNKISNVGAPGGVESAERVAGAVEARLHDSRRGAEPRGRFGGVQPL